MPESVMADFSWLSIEGPPNETWSSLIQRILLSFAAGLCIAGVYRIARRRQESDPNFPSTLLLLTILGAMVPQVIGDSVARAFSLVGALSIVRFRAIVEDTHDITYVIFSVLVGMALGLGHYQVAVVGGVVVSLAAICFHPAPVVLTWMSCESILVVRLAAGQNAQLVLRDILGQFTTNSDLVSVATSKQGTAVDVKYKIHLRPQMSPTDFMERLSRLEGVLSVELDRKG